MRSIKTFCYLFAISLLCTLSACKKTDHQAISQTPKAEIRPTALQISDSSSVAVNRIKDELNRLNQARPFFNRLQQQEGLPMWNKVLMYGARSEAALRGSTPSARGTIVMVPLVKENTKIVSSFLACNVLKDTVIIKLLRGRQYQRFGFDTKRDRVTGDVIALQLMRLQYEVFGDSTFIIKDKELLNYEKNGKNETSKYITIRPVQTPGMENKDAPIFYTECTCETYGSGQLTGLAPGETPNYAYTVTTCTDVTVYFTDGRYGAGYSTFNSYGGSTPDDYGSTNGGSVYNYTSIYSDPCAAYMKALPIDCEGAIGWEPVPQISSKVSYLVNALSLTASQSSWLDNNPARADEIYNYIIISTEKNKIQIGVEHINQMMTSAKYLSFVINHTLTGNNASVWWIDVNWIKNSKNFNLNISNSDYPELTDAERALIAIYPTQAYIISENVDKATAISNGIMGTAGALNGKNDAFRHAFFNAINTRDVPPRAVPYIMSSSDIVRLFAIAHETEVPPQLQLEKEMDLFNNEVGISYCWNCFPGITSDNSIATTIQTKILKGELKYLINLLREEQDPSYWGANNTEDKKTATHGINLATKLVLTNQ